MNYDELQRAITMSAKKKPVKTIKNNWGISWEPVVPVGAGRAKKWLIDGSDVTMEQWYELYQAWESADDDVQKEILAAYKISLPSLRKYSGIEESNRRDKIYTPEQLIQQLDAEIAEHQAKINDLESRKKKLLDIDPSMISMIAEMMKI